MSTRCRIGVRQSDGTVKSIYCHHDGYLEWVGRRLAEHYSDEKKLLGLVELGDISNLETTVEDTAPQSYHQWRGEDTPPKEDENEFVFWNHCFDSGEEFAYLFYPDDMEWQVKEATCPHSLYEELAKLTD